MIESRVRIVSEVMEMAVIAKMEQQESVSGVALLTGAAHDLGNHMSAIQGFSELLLMSGLEAEQRQTFSQNINRLSVELLQQFRNLVDYSKIVAEGLELEFSTVVFDALIHKRVSHFQGRAEKKNIVLQFESSLQFALQLDVVRMTQVIDQLLSNAIKFSPLGGRVDLMLSVDENEVVFSVQDQGEGIDKEEQNQLFSALHCLSTQPTEGEFGLGLGLVLAKQIVVAHKGVINVCSKPNEGSCFSVVLPISLA